MTRVLVTGAAGFIGGAVVRRALARGWEVHALLGATCRESSLEEVRGRLTLHHHNGSMEGMLAILAASTPDLVVHLASLFVSDHTAADVDALVDSNLRFPLQLVEAMVHSGCLRLVNTGTSWQHFGTESYRPVNLYAATKQAFEDLVAFHHDAFGLACTTLRLYDTYGPGDTRPKLIRLLLEVASTGRRLDLSPGDQCLELTHAEDVAEAFLTAGDRLLAAPAPALESFLVPGTRLSLKELVAAVSRTTGRDLNVGFGGRSYRAREVMEPVASEGRTLPGWSPRILLEEGLRSAFEALSQ